jgi:tetratricopeptide (TPR) repeat protein
MRLAVAQTPDSAEIHNKLGALLTQSGNLKAGIAEFEAAVRLNPDFAKAFYNLGVTNLSLADSYQSQGDMKSYGDAREAAFRAFLRTSQLDPKFPHVHDHLGAFYDEREDSSAAIAEFQKAIADDPQSVQSYYNLGQEFTAENKWDKAREAFESSTVLGPNLLEGHLNLLEVICRGNLNDAIEEYRLAVRRDPASGIHHAYLGYLLSRTTGMAEGKAELRTGVRLSPDLPVTRFLLGQVLEQEGEIAAAEEQYAVAARLASDQAIPHRSLGRILLQRNAIPEAVAELQLAASLDPASSEIAYILGKALRREGHLEEGNKELQRSRIIKQQESDKDTVTTVVAEGVDELELGEIDKAIQSFQLAIRKDRNLLSAHRYLGIALARKEDYSAAAVEFRTALQLSPQDPNIHLSLGQMLAKQGNLADAISELRVAVKHDPNLAEAHCNLALLLLKEGEQSKANEELSRAKDLGACKNERTSE